MIWCFGYNWIGCNCGSVFVQWLMSWLTELFRVSVKVEIDKPEWTIIFEQHHGKAGLKLDVCLVTWDWDHEWDKLRT